MITAMILTAATLIAFLIAFLALGRWASHDHFATHGRPSWFD